MLSSVLPKRGLPSASVVPKLSAMSSSSAETKNTDIQTVPGTSIQVHRRSRRAGRGGLRRLAVVAASGRDHSPTFISVYAASRAWVLATLSLVK